MFCPFVFCKVNNVNIIIIKEHSFWHQQFLHWLLYIFFIYWQRLFFQRHKHIHKKRPRFLEGDSIDTSIEDEDDEFALFLCSLLALSSKKRKSSPDLELAVELAVVELVLPKPMLILDMAPLRPGDQKIKKKYQDDSVWIACLYCALGEVLVLGMTFILMLYWHLLVFKSSY